MLAGVLCREVGLWAVYGGALRAVGGVGGSVMVCSLSVVGDAERGLDDDEVRRQHLVQVVHPHLG